MAGIEKIVQATVTKTSATVSRAGFGTVLGVHQVAVGIQSARFTTYSSIGDLNDAGFVAADRAHQWASVEFAQNPAPEVVAIGRRIPGVAQVRDLVITTAADGTWTLDLDDGDGVRQYIAIAAVADDDIAIAELFRAQIAQDSNAFVTVPSTATGTATVPITIGIAGETFTAVLTPAGAGAGTVAEAVANVAPEDLDTTLAAIEAENEKDWFLFTIDTRNDVDILKAAAFAGARGVGASGADKFFLAQSKDPDLLTATAGNIGFQLGAFSYDNVWLGYFTDDLGFHDAGMSGVAAAADLDAENGAITWANQELKGVAFSVLTNAQIDNIEASNANSYTEIAGQGGTLEGKAVSGEFADVATTMAWAKARSQEAVAAVILNTPTKVPFTNSGISSIKSAFRGVLDTGVDNGHFSGDVAGSPNVTAPKSTEVSVADKNARILRNVVGTAILAGAIHKTILQINLAV